MIGFPLRCYLSTYCALFDKLNMSQGFSANLLDRKLQAKIVS